jgi:hypothetical protein
MLPEPKRKAMNQLMDKGYRTFLNVRDRDITKGTFKKSLWNRLRGVNEPVPTHPANILAKDIRELRKMVKDPEVSEAITASAAGYRQPGRFIRGDLTDRIPYSGGSIPQHRKQFWSDTFKADEKAFKKRIYDHVYGDRDDQFAYLGR